MSLPKPTSMLDASVEDIFHFCTLREVLEMVLKDEELSKLLGKAIVNAPLHSEIITYKPVTVVDMDIKDETLP